MATFNGSPPSDADSGPKDAPTGPWQDGQVDGTPNPRGIGLLEERYSLSAFGFLAHPLMLRAIAAAKKKNDRIDAGKIADCLRCDVRHRRTILRIPAGIP